MNFEGEKGKREDAPEETVPTIDDDNSRVCEALHKQKWPLLCSNIRPACPALSAQPNAGQLLLLFRTIYGSGSCKCANRRPLLPDTGWLATYTLPFHQTWLLVQ